VFLGGILVRYFPVSAWGDLKDTEGRGVGGDAPTICSLRLWIAGEGVCSNTMSGAVC
jgi:hypothetical protein